MWRITGIRAKSSYQNLGNFLRWLALPPSVKHWTLTTLRDKLIKIGAKVVHHARYVTFQPAEVAVPRRHAFIPLLHVAAIETLGRSNSDRPRARRRKKT